MYHHALCDLQISVCLYTKAIDIYMVCIQTKRVYTETSKNDPHKLCHIKYRCNSCKFKINQNYLFYRVKNKNKIGNSCIPHNVAFFEARKLLVK